MVASSDCDTFFGPSASEAAMVWEVPELLFRHHSVRTMNSPLNQRVRGLESLMANFGS